MRHWFAALVAFVALVSCPGTAAQAGEGVRADTTWMSITLGGRKIGHLQIDRVHDGNRVVTTQDMQIALDRNGQVMPLAVLTRSEETRDGRPLAFHALSSLSRTDSVVDGRRRADGSYAVATTVAGVTRNATLEWPGNALLSDGQRQAMAAAGQRPHRYVLSLFDPLNQVAADVDVEVMGMEDVALPDGVEPLNHQRETLRTPRGTQRMDLWVNARGEIRKGTLDMLGHALVMEACSRDCALAPTQDIDMLRASMVDAPLPLSDAMRRGELRYRIHVADGDALPLIATDEQRVTRLGPGEWQVDVGDAEPGGQAAPTAQDTQPNAWLQSDAPAIRALAASATGGATDDLLKMQRLSVAVAGYIQPGGQDQGYASALEVLRSRAGDCKAHAVLLATLARAQGIPARVVTGMVYADHYADSTHVFVPHAWVQAWVNGRWRSYDAVFGRFDSGHVALDSGDGDPWHFQNLSSLFGQLRITRMDAEPNPATTALGGAVASRDW